MVYIKKRVRVYYEHIAYGKEWSSSKDIVGTTWEEISKLAEQYMLEDEHIVKMELIEESNSL